MISTHTDCVEMLVILSHEFEVPAPRFRFNRTYRGIYYALDCLVTIPRLERIAEYQRPAEAKLIHEFTHHLVNMRWRQRRGPQDSHGQVFKQHLWNVVTAWYGNPKMYPWRTEYKAVRAYGERRITTEELVFHANATSPVPAGLR